MGFSPSIDWEYKYDVLNRLESVKKNGVEVARYIYDPNGLRVAKLGSERKLYDFDLSGNVIEETDLATNTTRSYVWFNGQQLARVDGVIGSSSNKYFFENDHLGSPLVVTDNTGKVVWNGDHSPFGLQFVGDKNDPSFDDGLRFTGKDWDKDVELYYFNARWYDSETGGFISEDSYIGDPNDPRTLNYYTYCFSNPLNSTDPSGHEVEKEYNVSTTYDPANKMQTDAALTVTIEKGDTLSQIIDNQYGSQKLSSADKAALMDQIKEINGLESIDKISEGQDLVLPDSNGALGRNYRTKTLADGTEFNFNASYTESSIGYKWVNGGPEMGFYRQAVIQDNASFQAGSQERQAIWQNSLNNMFGKGFSIGDVLGDAYTAAKATNLFGVTSGIFKNGSPYMSTPSSFFGWAKNQKLPLGEFKSNFISASLKGNLVTSSFFGVMDGICDGLNTGNWTHASWVALKSSAKGALATGAGVATAAYAIELFSGPPGWVVFGAQTIATAGATYLLNRFDQAILPQ